MWLAFGHDGKDFVVQVVRIDVDGADEFPDGIWIVGIEVTGDFERVAPFADFLPSHSHLLHAIHAPFGFWGNRMRAGWPGVRHRDGSVARVGSGGLRSPINLRYIEHMFDARDERTRAVLRRAIAGIPSLLSSEVVANFVRDAPTHVRVHSLEEVAGKISALLPALLIAEGYMLVEVAHVEPDGFGGWSVRVPLSERPWADGEVYLQSGAVVLGGVPSRIPVGDAEAVAAALLAVRAAVEVHRGWRQ